jgi:dihydropteroate synthase-like protein
MNVLLITGTLAQETIQTFAQKSSTPTTTLALNTPVAAFLTPQIITQALKKENLKGYDMILVPGLIRGDVAAISVAVGVPTFKGPKYAADLPTVLDCLGEVTLSTTVPACELLAEKLRQNALQELAKPDQNKAHLLKRPHNLLIKQLAVGKDFPMRVLAEIVDAPLMSTEEAQQQAQYYVQSGADIVDVGMIAGENRPNDAKRLVKAVKAVVDVPVSIDTLNPYEIEAAVSAGADLILSLDAGNMEQLATFAINVPVVVIPTNQREGYFPKAADERVAFLEQNNRQS